MATEGAAEGAKVVVLGCNGLVGSRLAEHIVAKKTWNFGKEEVPLTAITLFDMRDPTEKQIGPAVRSDSRVSIVKGDLCDKATVEKLIDPAGFTRVVTIHLAAVLSGYAEENFDLGMKVNLFGTLGVMECVRALGVKMGSPQIYFYCSTDYVTCYNDHNKANPCNEDSFRLSPVSYGCQKASIELFVCDYSRRKFIDGRVGRLSAVLGRPGWSNSVSYPYTGIFTQPLEGKDYACPLPMDIPYPCSSLVNDVESIIYMAGALEQSALAGKHYHNVVVQVPARSYTLTEIWAATQEVAKEEGVTLGKMTPVPAGQGTMGAVKEINVCPRVSCDKAVGLGLPNTVELKEIIRDYVNRYIKAT